MKIYGKVYGKPPTGPRKKQIEPGSSAKVTSRPESQMSSVGDLDLSASPRSSPEQDVLPSGSRKLSAPALLTGVRARAKVIHPLNPKPRSASSTFLRTTKPVSGSGIDSAQNSSCQSTPVKNRTQRPTSGSMSVSVHSNTIDDEEEFSMSPPPFSNSRSPVPAEFTADDKLLLSQSDELCREVLSLCQGLTTNHNCAETDDLNLMRNDETGYTSAQKHKVFDMTGPELTSLPTLSLISSLASTPMVSARTDTGCFVPPTTLNQEQRNPETTELRNPEHAELQNPEKLVVGGITSELPPQSPSADYDFRKVFGILRMIEEEEAKGTEIETFLEENTAGVPSPSPSGSVNLSTLMPATANRKNSEQISEVPKISELVSDLPAFQPTTSEISCSTVRSSPSPAPLPRNESPLPENFDFLDSLFGEVKGQDIFEEVKSHNLFEEVKGQGQFLPNGGAGDWIRDPGSSRSSHISEPWENFDTKSQTLLSFLDEVEQSDRDKLFQLKFKQNNIDPITSTVLPGQGQGHAPRRLLPSSATKLSLSVTPDVTTASKLDTLIRKGSAELAREIMMLERQVEDSAHNVHILEETLISQRELNIRNMKNSEKDAKKRLKLQQEEFELTVTRHQAFVDQLITEKRSLQEKCEKILKESKETEEKFQQQIKSLQEKHLEEIKRLRKLQENSDKNKKQKWVGQKTQEIRDMTVKGLEPEVQRLIQRHQQEMSETRAYYADEIHELEERYARKQTHQLQELRENFSREKESACRQERELLEKRFEADFQRQVEELETQKRRWLKEMQEEKDRISAEEVKIRESAQENVRKGQIKCEVEIENIRQEHELKIGQLEKRHEREIQSLRDNFESQRENWITTFNKKNEQILAERESQLIEILNKEKEKEIREREKKCREDFERIRQEELLAQESRLKRLQEKFQAELDEFEKSERDLKVKFSTLKTEVLAKDEELFSIKTTLGLRTKENQDLTEANLRMLEERVNLTSIIRREFTAQIEALEEDCAGVKAAVVELKAKNKLELEQSQRNFEKFRTDKEAEMERIGQRVKQTLARKEETLIELGKQLEKSQIRINHLELLLEQQRKDFVKSMTTPMGQGQGQSKKK